MKEIRATRQGWLIVLILFLLNSAMVYPIFFPSLNQIGGWDESVYVHQGKELVEGTLPRLSANPAVAVLYAVTYLPFIESPQWLVHTDALGRFVLFVLLWVSSFLVAHELVELANPLIMMAFVAISPVVVRLLTNGSDALFAAMSAFALWQFLSFRRTQRLVQLALCSAFVGLAALSRPEGSLLFVVCVVLTVGVFVSSRFTRPSLLTHSIVVFVPFFVLVGGYVATYGVRTGDFTLGSAERSYIAFEQGHGIAFASSYGTLNPFNEGQKDARRLFGTPEENNHSVLRAIRRNPAAYLQRIPRLAYEAFASLLWNYNWHFAVFCFAFVVRGIIALIHARSYGLLAILLLWPVSNLLNILIIYQPTHLLIPFVTVFALAAIGVSAAATNLDSRPERQAWIAGLLALTVLGVAVYRRPDDLLIAPLLVLAFLWLTWVVAAHVRFDASTKERVTCLMFLLAALFIRFGILHEAVPERSNSPDAQATTWLRDHLPSGTRIGTYAPGVIWAVNMTPVTNPDFGNLTTSEALWAWLRREKIEAIYVDDALRRFEPVAWQTIRSQIGDGLTLAFDKASDRPSFDWRNAMFHSRFTDSEPIQVLILSQADDRDLPYTRNP